MTNFNINLAKDMASTEEERVRFYNGMLIYLVACAVLLVFVTSLSSVNLKNYLNNKRERNQLILMASTVSGLDSSVFTSPDKIYDELEANSLKILSLKQALDRRVHLLPLVHNLFDNLPRGVTLQMLVADRGRVVFGLNVSSASQAADLTRAWERNNEVMSRITDYKQVKSESLKTGLQTGLYVQFEFTLKE